jgi:protoporphyrinogen oxidase
MRVAIVGAGVGGLTAAHRLGKLGHECDVYERWPGLGGQAATLDVGGGVRIERYYHHAFRSDRHLRGLFEEIGLPDELEWHRSSLAMFAGGTVHPFTSPIDLLRYRPMSPVARLRMGWAVLALQRGRGSVEEFSAVTAHEWICKSMGRQAYDEVWGPMLRGKFGHRAEEVSMAWLWSKLMLRRELKGDERRVELLGYPKGSWEALFARLQQRIEDLGGRVMIDRPVARIGLDGERFAVFGGAAGSYRRGHDPRAYDVDGPPESYDAVVVTVPSDVFEPLLEAELADRVERDFRRRLGAAEYHVAVCMLLEVDRPMTTHYWTNIVDPDIPFLGVVEHTNFVRDERYHGRRFVYLANYVAPGDPLLELDADALLDRYGPSIARVSPGFERTQIKQRWLFREPAALPIVTVSYGDRIPPMRTGVPRLLLTNTTQIYPEDRGTNYAVKLAEEAVELLVADAGAAITSIRSRKSGAQIRLPRPIRPAARRAPRDRPGE